LSQTDKIYFHLLENKNKFESSFSIERKNCHSPKAAQTKQKVTDNLTKVWLFSFQQTILFGQFHQHFTSRFYAEKTFCCLCAQHMEQWGINEDFNDMVKFQFKYWWNWLLVSEDVR